MKNLLALVLLIGLGIGGYAAWSSWQKQKLAEAAPTRPTTGIATLRDISFAVNAAGEITPAEQVSVRPEINGKIELLPVDIGDEVKSGSILFKLDDKELQQQRASSQTDISRAKLELQKAERDLERAEELLKAKLIAQELYDDTKTSRDLAKVALERAERDLAIIEERLTKTEVRAPFDCTVLTRPISTGQAVSGSGGFNSGTEVLTIADLNSMIINAHVNQADVPRLKPEQQVEVSVEAVPGLSITGLVERIAPQATIKNNIKGYAARIVLKNVDPRVRPGMTANIRIPVASAEDVTSVPLAAVFTERNPDSERMERFVYVQTKDGFEKRLVKVGVSDFFYAEIQDGLSEGEVVSLELPKEERDKKARELARGGPREAGEKGARPDRKQATAAPQGESAPASTNTAPVAGEKPPVKQPAGNSSGSTDTRSAPATPASAASPVTS